MHPERPPKHYILHIFNAFIIFYYLSFLSIYPPPSLVVTPSIVRGHALHRSPSYPPSFVVTPSIVRRHILHCPWPYPPSFAVISSIVRDETLAFAATRWVFVAWRAQIEKKYNPQGGSIPPTSLPGVASYRRQPRAIKSTTPMGLMYHHPLITTPQRGDDARHGIYHHATTRSITIPSREVAHRIAIHCQAMP